MTIFKFMIAKLKNKGSNFWMILGLRFFVRILGISTMMYFLNFLGSKLGNETKYLYDLISTVFYILFFVFLDWYLKVTANSNLKSKGITWLKILKWIPLLFCLVLIYLTIQLGTFGWPEAFVDKGLYLLYKVWPIVFVPNLSFIIITVLIFYSSAILNRNMELKQENDLTI